VSSSESFARWAARAIAAGAVLLTLGVAQPAWAVDDGTLGIRPGGESDFFHLAALPGEAIEATAVVSNHSDQPVTLLTYPVDAVSSDTGFAMAEQSAPRAGVGSWVQLESEQVVVPPESELEVPFRLSIPAATPPGDYSGAIIIQSPPVQGDTTADEDGKAFRLDVVQRQGVRIYLDVEGTAVPALTHGELTWQQTDDGMLFSLNVTNTGTTVLHPRADLRLERWPDGHSTVQLSAPESMLPGATVTMQATAPGNAFAATGNAEATIRSEAGVDRARTGYWYARSEAGVALVVLVVLILLVWRIVRFLRRARAAIARLERERAQRRDYSDPGAIAGSLRRPRHAAGRQARESGAPRRHRATWAYSEPGG
jgi:Bacterial protein of unknown function (DUF916)